MAREIKQIDILVAPFFPYYQPLRHAHDLSILKLKDFQAFYKVWMQRIKQIKERPDAALVVARSRYSVEDTYVNPNPRDPKIEALERRLSEEAEKLLGDRLFVVAKHEPKEGRHFTGKKEEVVIGYKKMRELAGKRGFSISRDSTVNAYGASTRMNPKESWAACPGHEIRGLLEATGIKHERGKISIVDSLSIPIDDFHRFEKRKLLPKVSWARQRLDYGHKPRGPKRLP